MDTALNTQLREGKPELLRRKASLFGSVYYLDPAITGVAVFAKHREALADLRNHFGSGDCRFRFQFISAAQPVGSGTSFRADAPLLQHNVKPKMIPSTAKGKKPSPSSSGSPNRLKAGRSGRPASIFSSAPDPRPRRRP